MPLLAPRQQYGMQPNSEYGSRTHGIVAWQCGQVRKGKLDSKLEHCVTAINRTCV